VGGAAVTARRTVTLIAKEGQRPTWALDAVDITDLVLDWRIERRDDGMASITVTLSADLEVLLEGAGVDVLLKVQD
jgi:hypothetical protein